MNSHNQDFSRARTTKQIRSILQQYRVDLALLNISANKRYIHLSGILISSAGEDLSYEQMTALINDIEKISSVRSTLDNWDLNNGVTKIITDEQE